MCHRKRSSRVVGLILGAQLVLLVVGCTQATLDPTAPASDGVQGWAVLARKEDYGDVGMSGLFVDYIDVVQMRQMLEDFGWQPDHIRELREYDRWVLQDGLDWLAENADQDDIALLYVAGHGKFLKEVLVWGE